MKNEDVQKCRKIGCVLQDYKKTLKVTWIAEAEQGPQIPVIAVEYSHIISKAIVGKDEDWKHFVDHDSVVPFNTFSKSLNLSRFAVIS